MDKIHDHLKHLAVQGSGNKKAYNPAGTRCKEYLEHAQYEQSAYCVNEFYDKLDANQELSWWLAIQDWWMLQPQIAFFGPIMIFMASLYGWTSLIFPDSKPNMENGPWVDMEEKPIASYWNIWMFWIATTSMPNLYMWSQLFTWGESNISDFALMYMEPLDAFFYFWWNTIDLMFILYPYALVHTTIFGLWYLIEMFWTMFAWMFSDKAERK